MRNKKVLREQEIADKNNNKKITEVKKEGFKKFTLTGHLEGKKNRGLLPIQRNAREKCLLSA